MDERVFGIETEYPVLFHPAPGRGGSGARGLPRPTNLELYGLFEGLLEGHVRSLPRAASLLRSKRGRFLESGASFHYEATPQAFEHGLLELASPECRDPFTLLAHERAKDALVEDLAREATAELRRRGHGGEVRIGKNNVDSQGHTFGSHESYWVEDPLALGRKLALLPLWLGAWGVALPAFAWLAAVLASMLAVAVAALLLPLLAPPVGLLASALGARDPRRAAHLERRAGWLRSAPRRFFRWAEANPGELARRLTWIEWPLHPVILLHSALHRRFHFRAIRRALTAHLVTRTLYTGAGAVVLDGGPPLRLAQRPPFLRRLSRIFTSGDDRPIYESRDVFFRPWSAFGARRRLHLLVGDANLCEWSQVLRTGTTALVLEAVEADPGFPWPELREPLVALRTLNRDADLGARLELRGEGPATGLEIQRRYLEGVRAVLARAPRPPAAWKARVLAMWEETLRLLAEDPDALADRVDWLAKRSLLRREAPDPATWDALREAGAAVLEPPPPGEAPAPLRSLAYRVLRTDLRYHELGPRGGHRRLLARGAVRTLVGADDVERARREPPGDTRAAARGEAIREAASRGLSGGATWHRVRVGAFDWRFFPDPLRPDLVLRAPR